MAATIHLVVESGAEQGREISLPAAGARLGRSSKNDIVIVDPLLSRYHCRLYFKPGEGMWVADLGSANQTLLNGRAIQDSRAHVGDRISVGDTVLRVTADTTAEVPGQTSAIEPVIDLGFGREERPVAPGRRLFGMQRLIGLLCVVTVAAIGIWGWRIISTHATRPPRPPVAPAVAQPPDLTLEVQYEKVLADTDNIFRYDLRIDRKGIIAVQIDDVGNDRHVRKEAQVDPAILETLARDLLGSGFFALQDSYQGIQPNIHNLWDLTVTVGRRTHHTRVLNRVEPEVFKGVREKLEETGKAELGLWAIQFSPEKLVEMARDAYLLGKKLHTEREVKYGNLAEALKSFTEADWYLETVEPKPDFYPEVVTYISDCKALLEEVYKDHNFEAERAIRVREWNDAARELRIICELIPDRADPRNKEARRKLLEIETRLQLMK